MKTVYDNSGQLGFGHGGSVRYLLSATAVLVKYVGYFGGLYPGDINGGVHTKSTPAKF